MGPYAMEVAPAASKNSFAASPTPTRAASPAPMSWAAMATSRKASPVPQQVVQNTSDFSVKMVEKAGAKKIELKPASATTTTTTTQKPIVKPAEIEQIVQPAVPKVDLVVQKLNAELENKKKKKKAKKARQLEKSKLNMVQNGSCAMVMDPSSDSGCSSGVSRKIATPIAGGISMLREAYDMERSGSNSSCKTSSPLKMAQNVTSAPSAGYEMERGRSNDSKSTMASGISGSRQAYDMSRIGSNASSTSTAPAIVSTFSKLKDDRVANGSAIMMERVPSSKGQTRRTPSPQSAGISQLRDQISELNIGTNPSQPSRTFSYIQSIKNGFNKLTGSGQNSGYTTPGQMSANGDPEIQIPITGFSGTATPIPGSQQRIDSGISGLSPPSKNVTPHVGGKRCAEDFDVLRCLGKGAFGTVHLVREKSTGRLYAQKQFKKASITLKNSVIAQTMTEREILELVNRHPFIVKLYYAFQDHEKLYLILEYGSGGELFWHVNARDHFLEEEARFYVAETLLALEHLHKNLRVVYRDLKPENCLLDEEGHLLLTDFGLSKVSLNDEGCKSILGTKDYMAPEVLKGRMYGFASDFWALGCFAFHLMTGQPPFYSQNDTKTEQKILHGKIKFPIGFSADAKDLFTRLLRREPKKRLGYHSGDMEVIKNHRYFRGLDWGKLERRELSPPIIPQISNPEACENFDTMFTDLPLSPVLSKGVWDGMKHTDDPFGGFSYVARASMFDRSGNFGGRVLGDEEAVAEDIDVQVADDEDSDAEFERKRARAMSFDSMKSF